MLADNRIALNAGWDLEMLQLELTDLSVLGADLAALGFTAEELAKALNPAGTAGLTDENEIPELPEKAVTAVGDIWWRALIGLPVATAPTPLRSPRCLVA